VFVPPNNHVLLALPPTAASASVLRSLRSDGVSVSSVSDGIGVLDAVRNRDPALIVLDVELAARIRLRLRLEPAVENTVLRHGELVVDTEFGEVSVDGQPVGLSPTEYALLMALLSEPGEVVPPHRLAREVWSEPASPNLVQVYISYLRRKIGAERIRTVRGEGYVLEA
jgi:two-component system response regulator QseB